MSDRPINVAVIGFGYWGPNLARNFMLSERVNLRAIADVDREKIKRAARLYPSAHVTADPRELLNDPEIDLIACATPVSTHFYLGMAVLDAGKHLWLEKPMASSSVESRKLLEVAKQKGLQVFVDHTFVFTPAVQKMKSLVQSGDLGKLLYYDSTRINLGLFQHDVDVTWDLLPHDLSILDFLLDGRLPNLVSCHGATHYNELSDQAYVSLSYDDSFLAHVHVNWVAPVKVRQVLLCGDRKMLVYDEATPTEKLRVYDRGVSVRTAEDAYKRLIEYREGDMWAPRLEHSEALAIETNNVVDALEGNAPAIVGGEVGHRIVLLLEAATTSRENHGRPIRIDSQTGESRMVVRKRHERSA